MSTFSLILPGRHPTSTPPAAATEPCARDPVRSQRLAPASRRDRRQAAGPADRPGGDRVAGRRQQERRQPAGVSTGARGRDHPPARRTSPRRLPCRNPRSHVAGDVGSNGPVAIPFFGRRIRPCRSAGVLGSGARPLRQQYADVGLRHRGSGDPRGGRRNRPRSASCRCRRRKNPIRGGRICCRPTTTRRGSSRACRSARAATPAPTADALAIGCGGQQESGLDRTLLGAECSAAISRRPDLGASLDRRAGMHLPRVQRSRQGGLSDRDRRLCADLGPTPRRLSLGAWCARSSGCCRSAATRCRSRRRLSATRGPSP